MYEVETTSSSFWLFIVKKMLTYADTVYGALQIEWIWLWLNEKYSDNLLVSKQSITPEQDMKHVTGHSRHTHKALYEIKLTFTKVILL